MQDKLYLDIETVTIPEIPYEHPKNTGDFIELKLGNMVDPKKIEAKKIENMELNVKEYVEVVKKAVVDHDKINLKYGGAAICCIAFAWNDEPVHSFSGYNELDVLTDFSVEWNGRVIRSNDYSPLIIGHNVKHFDIQKIYESLIKWKFYNFAAIFNKYRQTKPWETDLIYDTMTQFSGHPNKGPKQHDLCTFFEIETSKGDMDGSKVGEAYRSGRIEEIATYGEKDVEVLRNIYKRMTGEI